MKWAKIWLIFMIATLSLAMLFARPSRADNPVVTMTVSGWVIGSPILTITWVSDTEVRLDWIQGELAVGSMVRMKIGEQPEDRNDGYFVYSGNATTYTDKEIDLDKIINYAYYGLWSCDNESNWSTYGSFGYVGGSGMIDIADSLSSLKDNMMPFMLIAMMIPLIFFTWLTIKIDSDWGSPILALITGGLAFFLGYNAPNIIGGEYQTTAFGLAVAVALIVYSLLCVIWSWSMMFKGRL